MGHSDTIIRYSDTILSKNAVGIRMLERSIRMGYRKFGCQMSHSNTMSGKSAVGIRILEMGIRMSVL